MQRIRMLNPRLLLVALIWGVNFSIVKYALADVQPLVFAVIRFTLASLFLFGLLRAAGQPLALDRRERLAVLRLGIVGIALYNLLFLYGLAETTASSSALLISLSPLVGALIQRATGREHLSPRSVAGLLIAAGGAALIITGRAGRSAPAAHVLRGDLLTLGATVCWALYTVMARPLLVRNSAVKITAYTMAAGAFFLLPLALPSLARQSWSGISTGSWLALGYSAFIAAGVAFSLWYRGVRELGVTRTMAYHYLMPAFALLFAAFFLHEQPGALRIAGGIAGLLGVWLVQRGTPGAGPQQP